MKTLLLIICLTFASTTVFGKDEKPKETSGTDLVCKQIKIIAGDDSKVVKAMENVPIGSGEGGYVSGAIIVRCENSTSICYASSGSALSCHKK